MGIAITYCPACKGRMVKVTPGGRLKCVACEPATSSDAGQDVEGGSASMRDASRGVRSTGSSTRIKSQGGRSPSGSNRRTRLVVVGLSGMGVLSVAIIVAVLVTGGNGSGRDEVEAETPAPRLSQSKVRNPASATAVMPDSSSNEESKAPAPSEPPSDRSSTQRQERGQEDGRSVVDLAALNREVRKACEEENFGDALKLVDEAGRRVTPRQQAAIVEIGRGIREESERVLVTVRDRVYWARKRGDGDEVAKHVARATTWGVPELLEKVRSTLAEVDRELAKAAKPAEPQEPATVAGSDKESEPAAPPTADPPSVPKGPEPDAPPKADPPPVPAAPKPQKPAQVAGFKGVDQRRVDEAIAKGIVYLKATDRPVYKYDGLVDYGVLVLWTYVHAGVSESDAKFKELFDKMLSDPLDRTYKVALQAMILEEVDRVKYQERIWQCAQFLLDNQGKEGSWGYGRPTEFTKDVPTGTVVRKAVASAGAGRAKDLRPGGTEERVKPKVERHLPVRKMRDGAGPSDNSNAQYAALGLRACHEAGIVLPKEVVALASKWWRDSQKPDRGGKGDSSVASGLEPAGWCYGKHDHKPYGSMTAGAVGALAIYDYILDPRQSWKRDRDVVEGLQWLAKHFTVTFNPGPYELNGKLVGEDTTYALHYYLYALERAGVLCGVEKLGANEWYRVGANFLLEKQKPDGSWDGSTHSNSVWDTCFAILFLKRATRPLEDVASVDRLKR